MSGVNEQDRAKDQSEPFLTRSAKIDGQISAARNGGTYAPENVNAMRSMEQQGTESPGLPHLLLAQNKVEGNRTAQAAASDLEKLVPADKQFKIDIYKAAGNQVGYQVSGGTTAENAALSRKIANQKDPFWQHMQELVDKEGKHTFSFPGKPGLHQPSAPETQAETGSSSSGSPRQTSVPESNRIAAHQSYTQGEPLKARIDQTGKPDDVPTLAAGARADGSNENYFWGGSGTFTVDGKPVPVTILPTARSYENGGRIRAALNEGAGSVTEVSGIISADRSGARSYFIDSYIKDGKAHYAPANRYFQAIRLRKETPDGAAIY